MTWTVQARAAYPLSMVMDGRAGIKHLPVLFVVWERSRMEGRLDCLYVAKTTYGAHSRLTWHVQRGTGLGKYLQAAEPRWAFDFIVDMELIPWRIDEAELTYRTHLKPKFYRGERGEKVAGAIIRSMDRSWHPTEGFLVGRWRDGMSSDSRRVQ